MTYEAPKVVVHNAHERSTPQPAHSVLPRLPMRAFALRPSGSGKAVFIESLIVDLMRTRGGGSVFLHVSVWSPSIHMDPVWLTVKDFAKKVLKQNEEECFLEEFNPADLQGVIDKQQKLIESLKARGIRTLPRILIALDDIP